MLPPHTHLCARMCCGCCCEQVEGKRQLLMEGTGASPEGNRPFLDLLDLDSEVSRRIWQSSPPFYETAGSIMSDLPSVRGGGLQHVRRC